MERQLPDPTDELWRSLREDVMRLGADVHTAEDVVQETWLRAVRRPPEDRGRFRGWLHVVAARTLRQIRLGQQRQSVHLHAVARAELVPAEGEAEPTPLVRFVDELPALYRDVVHLRFLEDRSVEEIAALTGRSEEAVRTQLKRGLRRLRARLGVDAERRSDTWLGLGWLATLLRPRKRGRVFAACGAVAICAGVITFVLARRDARARELRLADAPPATAPGATALAAPETDELATRVSVPTESVLRVAPVTGVARAPDGAPAPGAVVHAMPADESGPERRTDTDALGRYTLDAGPHDVVWATHPDSLPSNRIYVGSAAAGSDLDLNLFKPWATADYVVQSSDGAPVVGAEVVAGMRGGMLQVASTRDSLQFTIWDPSVWTDSEGRARVHIPSEHPIDLFVTVGGEFVWRRHLPGREAALLTLITLSPGTAVGTVVDDAGRPARNALVELVHDASYDSRRAVRTGVDGSFLIDGVLPGPFTLRLLQDLDEGTASARREGEVTGDRIDFGEIALQQQMTIHGRVLRGTQPVAGTRVTLRTESGVHDEQMRTTTTDQDGRYAFGGCRAESIRFVFTTPTFGALYGDCAPARPGPAPIDLAAELLGPTAPVVFEFSGPSAPLLVELRREPFASSILAPEPGSGIFRSAPLPAGSYEVLAWVSELGTWRCGTIVHAPPAPPVQRFETPRGALLAVELGLPPGSPRTGGVALLTPAFYGYGTDLSATSNAYMHIPWDENEQAFAAIVAPQTYRVATYAAGVGNTVTRVVVEDGHDVRLVVPLAPSVPGWLHFRSPRALTLGEVVEAECDSPRGTIHLAFYWTDQRLEEDGFSFEGDIPRGTSEIRALTVSRPDANVNALRGVRRVAPEELDGKPLELEVALE